MNIPHSRPLVRREAMDAVLDALRRASLSQGDEVRALETAVAGLFPGMTAVATASGTAALYLVLRAVGAAPGHDVLVPSFTCESVRAAVALLGARAVPVDSVPNGLNLSATAARRLITPRTAAVVVSHQFGFEADVDRFVDMGLPVIEDCAHAPAVRGRDGAVLGTRGQAAILSFYATKLVPAGEGGCVVTADPEIAARVRERRNCDRAGPLNGAFNFKMSDLHAALARPHLAALPAELARREAISCRLDSVCGHRAVRRHPGYGEYQACPFRYLIAVADGVPDFIAAAHRRGVICRRPVLRPLHRDGGGACPHADRLYDALVSVPCYPALTPDEEDRLCSVISEILQAF
ncbi:MAG: DegT/DnrJ/EryC1/StrS aminotransferase family protein [Kiritimatiellaeota bacterium]|nr:DegT/DnrJ/EryC1/StrS aminotransferase family protein [Kiritimatiellota bacterium]